LFHAERVTSVSPAGVSFLGEIPLDPRVTVQEDAGAPIVAAEPDSVVAKAVGA